ncbi:sodium bile acid symporter family-domain-containing protein [Lipomyces starkeyi]
MEVSTSAESGGTEITDRPSPAQMEQHEKEYRSEDLEKGEPAAPTEKQSVFKSLGLLDRFLAAWIFLAMAIDIILGNFVPNTGPALQKGQFVGVSIPIAIGLLVMMYPILCKVKYETLHRVFRQREVWVQILFSIVVNLLIVPFLMLGLSWAFPDKSGLREGLILVGLARCIAMVSVATFVFEKKNKKPMPVRSKLELCLS